MDKDESLYQQISTTLQPLGAVEALLLTSFGLDVSYLEKAILPAFFPHLGDGPSSEPHRPLYEYLEEQPTPISVMFDANHLQQAEVSLSTTSPVTKELRWQAHPITRKSGCFHPKLIVAQMRKGDQVTLVVGCSSANLTKPGWGKNLEACALDVIPLREGIQSTLLVDVQALLNNLLGLAPRSVAIDILLKTLMETTPRPYFDRRQKASYRTRLWFGQDGKSLKQLLANDVLKDDLADKSKNWRLEVISPYFSDNPPEVLKWASRKLRAGISERETLISCLCPYDGELFNVSSWVVEEFNKIHGFRWAKLPGGRQKSGLKDSDGNNLHRFVHAKVYRFWTPQSEVLVVGSANATTQGNCDQIPGNDEACLIFSRTVEEGAKPLTAWLMPMDGEINAEDCRVESVCPEDVAVADPVPSLSISYDWASHEIVIDNRDARDLAVYLGGDSSPLDILLAGETKILVLTAGQAQSLYISPVLKVSVPYSRRQAWLCLVEESNLHAKPPAPSMERSVDDLIRDWQMGECDRQADHIARVAMPDDMRASSSGVTPELDTVREQDRLNDIFLAMWRFRSELLEKIGAKADLDRFTQLQIQSRLFGQGAMSVRYFVSKLNPERESAPSNQFDPVERYIAMLCLRENVEVIRVPAERHGFTSDMRQLIEDLSVQLDSAKENLLELLRDDPRCPDATALVEWVEANYSLRCAEQVAS